MLSRRRLAAIGALVGIAAAVLHAGDDWPQWRGPHGLGISAETGVVTDWSPTKNVVWKTEIPGRGPFFPHRLGQSHLSHDFDPRRARGGEPVYASPAIAGGRIYIRGEKHLFAIGSR